MSITPDWSTIDTVLLDMDGTLLDLHFDNFFWLTHLPRRYAEHHGICPDKATQDLHKQFNAKRGTLDWYCLEYWSEQLSVDIALLKHEISHLIAERPFVQQFLQHLKNCRIQRVLITNAHPQSLAIKLEMTQISDWLDVLVSSHNYGYPKESQLFWKKLLDEHPFDPDRTLFIDDSEPILESARQFGIKHLVWMRQPDSREQPRDYSAFPSIIHFDELLPQSPGTD